MVAMTEGDQPVGDEEAHGLALMRDAGAALVAGVRERLPLWVIRSVERILDAWGGVAEAERSAARADATAAGAATAQRVAEALAGLLALDPAEQRATPLEIIRSAYREPTEVLAALGVPPVVRDEFAERAWPDDVYGLAIASLAELRTDAGAADRDDDLGPLHLAWGLGKAKVITARQAR